MPLQFTKSDMGKGIYFSDSLPDVPLDPTMQQRLLSRLGNGDYRHKWMIPGLAEASHMPYSARKSYAANGIIGMNGLVYAVCEQMEYGYGIFSGWTDDEYLLTWLGPMMFFQQERLQFRVFNWTDYLRNVGNRGSSAVWGCTVGAHADIPAQGCIINYCFEPDRHNSFGVPAGVRPSDVVEPCIVQPTLNILGQRITDRVQMREFSLMWGMRLQMLHQLFNGDYCYAGAGNNGQEDGVIKWFDNWTGRHTELSRDCINDLGPSTYNVPVTAAALTSALNYTVTNDAAHISQAQMEYVVITITKHIIDVEWKLREIDGGSVIPFEKIGILMNPQDAMCMVWYQFCQIKCAGDVGAAILVDSFAKMNQFYLDFQTRLHSGLYGGGILRLHDGREISIMPLRRMTQGTVLCLIKGWDGASPNPYGFRIAAQQYNEWWSQVQRTVPMAALKYRLVLNGTGIRMEPTDACSDIEVWWNQRIFSNAPWMQMKIVGMPACADVQVSTWPSMPAMATYSNLRCAPAGCQ